MTTKIVVPYYPIDVKGKEDYMKFMADITGGELVPVANLTNRQIIKKLLGNNVHASGRGLPFPELACLFAKNKIYTPHFNVVGVTKKSSVIRSRLWNRYHKIIALTDYAKRNFIKEGINTKKIEVLTLAIDYKKYQKLNGGKKFRKKYGIGEKEPFVLVVGLRQGKNVDVIAEACIKTGVKCLMVGATEKSHVRPGYEWLLPPKRFFEIKNENIIVTGLISNDELLAAFDAATIYANSSNHTFECFSLSTYQCAASGVPLCLPDFGVFDKFKKYALFHNNKNPNQLAANIEKYLSDKTLMKKNISGAKKVAKNHDYYKVRKLYEGFYQRIDFI